MHGQGEMKQFSETLLQYPQLAPMARWQQITDPLPELLERVDNTSDVLDESLHQALTFVKKDLGTLIPDTIALETINTTWQAVVTGVQYRALSNEWTIPSAFRQTDSNQRSLTVTLCCLRLKVPMSSSSSKC